MFLGSYGSFIAPTLGHIAIFLGRMETEHTRFGVIHSITHKTLPESDRLIGANHPESPRFTRDKANHRRVVCPISADSASKTQRPGSFAAGSVNQLPCSGSGNLPFTL